LPAVKLKGLGPDDRQTKVGSKGCCPCLSLEPKVLLLDEPLSNLDANLRLTMRGEIRKLQERLKVTTIFVTHDQFEAMSISDRIVVMKEGVIQQIGSPTEIYERPDNEFIASFVGFVNFLEGKVERVDLGLERATASTPIGNIQFITPRTVNKGDHEVGTQT
jgi:ABC-type sugar transport system ATPase subunit